MRRNRVPTENYHPMIVICGLEAFTFFLSFFSFSFFFFFFFFVNADSCHLCCSVGVIDEARVIWYLTDSWNKTFVKANTCEHGTHSVLTTEQFTSEEKPWFDAIKYKTKQWFVCLMYTLYDMISVYIWYINETGNKLKGPNSQFEAIYDNVHSAPATLALQYRPMYKVHTDRKILLITGLRFDKEIKIIFKYRDCLKVLRIVIYQYKDLVVVWVLSSKRTPV